MNWPHDTPQSPFSPDPSGRSSAPQYITSATIHGRGNPNGVKTGVRKNDQYLDEDTGLLYVFNGTPGARHGWSAVSNFINIQSFGATNGSDSTDAFRRAVAAASNGMAIYIPDGSFIIDSVDISKDLSIIGHGTLLHKAGASNHMLRFTVPQTGKVEGVTLDGNKDNQTSASWFSILSTYGKNQIISRVIFQNYCFSAVHDNQTTQKLTVDNCIIRNGKEHGGILNTTLSTAIWQSLVGAGNSGARPKFTITNNQIYNESAPSSAGLNPGGIIIKGEDANGIYPSVLIENNFFNRIGQDHVGNRISPIEMYEDIRESIIRGNRIVDCYVGGMDLQNCSYVEVENNFIDTLGADGSSIAAGIEYDPAVRSQADSEHEGGFIRNNVIRNVTVLQAYGIWVHGEEAEARWIDVSGNFITNVKVGIQFDGLNSIQGPCIISNNIVRVTGANSIGFDGVNLKGSFVFSGNYFESLAGGSGLLVTAGGSTTADLIFEGNTIRTNEALNKAFSVRGVRKCLVFSGLFDNVAGGDAVDFRQDGGGNPIVTLYYSPSAIIANGTSNFTVADITNFIGGYSLPDGRISYGTPNAPTSTFRHTFRYDVAASNAVMAIMNNTAAGGAVAELIANDAQGSIGAWSKTFASTRFQGRIGLSAASSANGILLGAIGAAQDLRIHIGSTDETARFDFSVAAGNTRFMIYDVDSGLVQRVKVGANGTGPGGVGRALYIDNS